MVYNVHIDEQLSVEDIMKHKIVDGMIIGGLEIINLFDIKFYKYNGKKQAQTNVWLCRCIHCKQELKVRQSNVLHNQNGCKNCNARISGLKERKYAFPSMFWNRIKFRAKNKDRVLEVDDKFLFDLFVKQNGKCKLSGVDITIPQLNKDMKKCTASLDRIDSSKGYIRDNVQWIHKEINAMKMAVSDEKLIEWCHIISKHNEQKTN